MNKITRGGSASVRYENRTAGMQVLDVDEQDPTVKGDAWFVYLLPTQTGVQMLPSQRYGYWDDKPKVIAESDLIIIGDVDDRQSDEPILIMTPTNTHSVYLAKAEHLEAKPLPVPKQPEAGAMTG